MDWQVSLTFAVLSSWKSGLHSGANSSCTCVQEVVRSPAANPTLDYTNAQLTSEWGIHEHNVTVGIWGCHSSRVRQGLLATLLTMPLYTRTATLNEVRTGIRSCISLQLSLE